MTQDSRTLRTQVETGLRARRYHAEMDMKHAWFRWTIERYTKRFEQLNSLCERIAQADEARLLPLLEEADPLLMPTLIDMLAAAGTSSLGFLYISALMESHEAATHLRALLHSAQPRAA